MIAGSGYAQAISLLQEILAIPALSRDEGKRADFFQNFLEKEGCRVERIGHNLITKHNPEAPYRILLNSHLDTVKAASTWTKDPYSPEIIDGKLYGLGSNDAGGSLVALLVAFLTLRAEQYPHQLILVLSAEEEISGTGGVAMIRDHLGKVDAGIIGEPTSLQVAVAEKGLMVIDAAAHGVSGHAARDEGLNAIYKAIEDIQKIKTFQLDEVSPWLGAVKMTVTQINSGTQHNVIPDICKYVIDVRSTEKYSNQQILERLQRICSAQLTPRSTRLQPSGINLNHPIIKACQALDLKLYGSPTLSDQALWQQPTIKLGCGDSARSHTADEYIALSEIENGINLYLQLLRLLPQYIKPSL